VVRKELIMTIDPSKQPYIRLSALLLTFLFCGSAVAAEAEEEAEEIPLPLQAYQVNVKVAFGDSTDFQTEFRQRLRAELEERCERYWGRMCLVEISETEEIAPAGRAALENLELTHEAAAAEGFDKLYYLTVETEGNGYRVSGKVLDTTLRETSDVYSQHVYRRIDISDQMFITLGDLFEPIVEISAFDYGVAYLTIRGGELLPPDVEQAQLKPGRMLVPFYRFLSREGEVRRIQKILWTYLVVTEVNRATATCEVVSGLRTPISAKRRRTIQALAVGVRPRYDSTSLRFVSQQFNSLPLFGVSVSVVPDKPEPPAAKPDETAAEESAETEQAAAEKAKAEAEESKPAPLMTNRDGSVTFIREGEDKPLMLMVTSGKMALAKVPIVPGLTPTAEIQLPDDSIRLNVEGKLAVLESKLIDTVARRAVLVARTRDAMQKNDWDLINELMERIDTLGGPGPLQTELTIIRERGVSAAQQRGDKSAQRRIERLCAKTAEAIENYLSLEQIREFQAEVSELRQQLEATEKK